MHTTKLPRIGPLRQLAALAALLLALAGCSDDPAEPSAPDAAVDASSDVAPDVSEDVSPDVAPDAGVDTAPDVAPDAGVDADLGADADASPDADGGCQEDVPAAFADAEPLAEGRTDADSRDSSTTEIGHLCSAEADAGREDVYRFELAEQGLVSLKLSPHWQSNFDPILSLYEACGADAGQALCRDDGAVRQAEEIERMLEPGVYYVVVQGNDGSESGRYSLEFSVDPVVCQPGEASCTGTSVSEVCNVYGTGTFEVACETSCVTSTGLCRVEAGDACYAAIDATGGYAGSIDWSLHRDDYDPQDNSCVPDNYGSVSTDGPDVAYRVELADGEALRVDLKTSDDYASLYLVRDCQNAAGSCVVGANAAVSSDDGAVFGEQLAYRNDSGLTETLYVIADSGQAAVAGTAAIEIRQGAPSCASGERRCAGDAVEVCGAAGLGFETLHTCVFGCDAVQAACATPPNEQCRGAVDLTAAGGSFTARIDEYAHDIDPGEDGCTGRPAPGPDAVFSVSAQAGEVVTVELDAAFDAALWVTDDCSQAAQSCIAGADAGGQRFESLQFVAPRDGVYFVVADAGHTASGEFTVSATTAAAASCAPGEVLGCASTQNLSYCSELGVPASYRCTTGCTMGACDTPRGDICADAVALQPGDSVNSSVQGADAIDLGAGSVGACDVAPGSTAGADDIYSVELQAGDYFYAELRAASGVSLYLLEECGAAATCTDLTAGNGVLNSKWVTYEAQAARTIYLVVDSDGVTVDTTYNLAVDVLSPVCTPGEARCASNGIDLEACDAWGTWQTVPCTGGCANAACVQPAGDVCQDAILLDSGDVAQGTFEGSDSLGLDGAVDACSIPATTQGGDTFFAVELQAGQMLSANLVSDQSAAIMYLLSGCGEAGQCLANGPRGTTTRLEYIAQQAETVYLVVDSTRNGGAYKTWELSVSKQYPGCFPGDVACLADGKSLGRCTDEQVFDTTVCSTTCTNGACDDPQGDICLDAIPAQSGDSFTGDFGGTRQWNPGTGVVGGCDFGELEGAGTDTVYVVDLLAGQWLEAQLNSTDPRALMYVLEDCDRSESCRASSRHRTLEYRASVDETVYLVVDSDNPQRRAGDTYTLDVLVDAPSCTPGTSSCLDSQTLEYCDEKGLKKSIGCVDPSTGNPSTCSAGSCDTPASDVCADAEPLAHGDVVFGGFDGQNAVSTGGGWQGSCWFADQGGAGNDRVYSVDLTAGEVLDLYVSASSDKALVYILGDCLDVDSCQASTYPRSQHELQYKAEVDETVYVVVDYADGTDSSAETFQLFVDVLTPSCTPGTQRCKSDGVTLETCNANGVWDAYACQDPATGQEQSCVAGACSPQMGDVCTDAIALQSGDRVSGTWQGNDTLNPPPGAVGACNFDSAMDEGLGNETIYSVELLAGEVLTARVESAAQVNWVLYLLQDCSDTSTCAVNTNRGYQEGELTYQASVDETVYLVVDGARGTSTSDIYDLSIDVQTPSCTPGARQCDAGGVDLKSCNESGVWESVSCASGCSQGACNRPEGDRCFDPIVLVDGDSVTGNWNGRDDIRLPASSGACDFGAADTGGTDTIYRVDLQAGQVLAAELTPDNLGIDQAVLYVLDGCPQDAGACLAATGPGNARQLHYTASSTGPVYLVVDSTEPRDTSTGYTLDVSVQTPGCTPGSTQCAPDGKTLQVCNDYQVYDSFECDGTCSAGKCDTPTGDLCFDALPLGDGDEFSGRLGDYARDLDPGVGSCILDPMDQQDGRDAVFSVALAAGETLEAKLYTAHAYAGMYVLENCTADTSQACLHARPVAQELDFYAHEAGTYYLVVDSRAGSYDSDFTLTVDINQRLACQPGGSSCDDATGQLSLCDERGGGLRATSTCAYGCDGPRCAGPPLSNDTCADAPFIDQSTRIADSFERFGDDHDPAACVDVSLAGPDAVYAVSLEAGERVVATAEGPLGMRTYFLRDCADANSCIPDPGGSTNRDAIDHRAGYVAGGDELVYLVVDHSKAGRTGDFVVDIDIAATECQPGQSLCADTQTLQVCDAYGSWEYSHCASGCASGACSAPSNDMCTSAMNATGGVSTTLDPTAHTNQLDPADAAPSCTGSAGYGPDAVYYVDAFKNDVIRASAYGLDDVSVWITTDCATAALSCVAGQDASEGLPEKLDYVVPSDGRYYVVVDSYWPDTAGQIAVDVSVDGPTCQAGEATCLDATLLSYCANDGTGLVEYTCDGLCSNGACTQPRGDICPDAIPVTATTTFAGDYSSLGDTFDPGFAGCTGFDAPGPDAAYAVDLAAGQTLSATLRSTTLSEDLSLYVVADCTDAANTCLAGSDAFGAGDETVTYTATQAQTVYVIADSYDVAMGTYELDVEIS